MLHTRRHPLENAYEILKPYGIGPHSSMREIDNCTFRVMKDKRLEEARDELHAIQSLKQVAGRLLADFFFPRRAELGEGEPLTPQEIMAMLPETPIPTVKELLEHFAAAPLQLAAAECEAVIGRAEEAAARRDRKIRSLCYRPRLDFGVFLEELM